MKELNRKEQMNIEKLQLVLGPEKAQGSNQRIAHKEGSSSSRIGRVESKE